MLRSTLSLVPSAATTKPYQILVLLRRQVRLSATCFPPAQLLVDLRGTSDNPAKPRAAMESVILLHPQAKLPGDGAAVGKIYRDLPGRCRRRLQACIGRGSLFPCRRSFRRSPLEHSGRVARVRDPCCTALAT
jgi:hypothetical protein